MKESDLRSQEVMNIDKGESIEGLWATPQIPQIGVYKLVVKQRADGIYEWVHFQHRPDGTRKVLFRGELETKVRITDVLEAANENLHNVYGVTMSVADVNISTLDGRKSGDTVH
jgi:hypothetical protein